ncbi:MAG TPA: hypothetical protein VJO53_12275 [Candidatus Acidoferrales bacterium]|nr:hypothetical protein [Candidatus Acidoferrales bacterium]
MRRRALGRPRRGFRFVSARLIALLTLIVLVPAFHPALALAGPPFQTDDPEPVDFRHYEFYTFGAADGTAVAMNTAAPAVEFNWGVVPNVQLHLVVPAAGIFPSNNPNLAPSGTGPNAFGLGDIELGVKYRFIQETRRRPMVGSFTMFEIPSGNPAKGLGAGKGWAKLPIWVQKSFGPWTTYGGVGETINTAAGNRNFTFGGWLVQRDIGKKLTLGSEVFSHGREGLGTAQTRAATLVDLGGYYYFRNPGFQLLFCYGHTAVGQAENYAYLGLYWTWGGKAGDSDKSAQSFARLLPRF